MLEGLYPEAHGRYLSLPVLGQVLDDFAKWLLLDQGYRPGSLRVMLTPILRLDQALQDRGVYKVEHIEPDVLQSCWVALHGLSGNQGGAIRAEGPGLASARFARRYGSLLAKGLRPGFQGGAR